MTAPFAGPLFEAVDLHHSYGGVRAVDGVSFTVDAAEMVGMIGANGCGKTTTLNILTRLTDPDAGTMRIGGVDYSRRPPHHLVALGISRTFQNLRLFHDLTVRENVALAAERTPWRGGRAGREGQRRTAALVERLGLQDLQAARPRELPYGTQRVVEIARALASQPALVFLDEPFAGMSDAEARDISDILRGERSQGTSFVIVDHNVEVLTGVVDRLVALAQGTVVASGGFTEVLEDPQVVDSYIGTVADV